MTCAWIKGLVANGICSELLQHHKRLRVSCAHFFRPRVRGGATGYRHDAIIYVMRRIGLNICVRWFEYIYGVQMQRAMFVLACGVTDSMIPGVANTNTITLMSRLKLLCNLGGTTYQL